MYVSYMLVRMVLHGKTGKSNLKRRVSLLKIIIYREQKQQSPLNKDDILYNARLVVFEEGVALANYNMKPLEK